MGIRSVIQVEHLSKEYRLGVINHGTLRRDLQSWWARFRGNPDPNSAIREFQDCAENRTTRGKNSDADDGGEFKPAGGRFLALDDVSFEVNEGEIFGVIGPNGAGKSTLLKILCRITAPTTGVARMRGRIASMLEVGTGFHPELSGRENVFLNGAILGMSRAEVRRKFDEIVEFAQLARFIDTPVKRYSSGMYTRLAFSVAAHFDAEVMIIDEVLAVGDFEFQKKCSEKMRDITSRGRTVIFVSHNMGAVQKLCTRAILLLHGRIVETGATHQVVESYLAGPSKTGAMPIPLAQRGDRIGNGAFRFVDVGVEADPLAGAQLIRSGVDVSIRIGIGNRQQGALRNVDVAVGIDNCAGERVAIFTTKAVAGTVEILPPGRSCVDFKIARLPLVAGRYSVTLFGTVSGEVADWVQSAASFDVAHGDFFGTGQTIPTEQSCVLIPYRACSAGGRLD
jgi:lipopolysaccharide transport system ATP-binding protein